MIHVSAGFLGWRRHNISGVINGSKCGQEIKLKVAEYRILFDQVQQTLGGVTLGGEADLKIIKRPGR